MIEKTDPASGRSEVLRAQVQAWLMEEGWQVGQATPPGAEWFLTGVDDGGRHIGVGQKRGSSDQLIIQGSVNVGEEHQRQLAALSLPERQEFIWDLRFRLLATEVEFNGVGDPLVQVHISQRIYQDGLTKDAFLQRVSQVKRGVLAVLWSVGRKLEQTPPEERTVGFRPAGG